MIRGHIAAYSHVSVSTVESKDGLMKPLCVHCSILAVLSSRLLKLHKSGDNSAVTSRGFALRLITAEVQGRQIISCQKLLELQQNEFCVQNHLCEFSILNPEIEAEQKLNNLPGAEERHRLQGERGGAGDSQDTFITWQIVLSYQHALQGKLTT